MHKSSVQIRFVYNSPEIR